MTIPGLRCPVCHDGLAGGSAPLVACSGCLTIAHAECVQRRCPTLGCRGAPSRTALPCRSWPWLARVGLAAIAPAIVVAALILHEALLVASGYVQPIAVSGPLQPVAFLDLDVTRAVVDADGTLRVEGGGAASCAALSLSVNGVEARVHHRPMADEWWWSVQLPNDAGRNLQGEWFDLRLDVWSADRSWSWGQTVPVVDSRAFDPARTDGALVDVAVVASTTWQSVPLRGRITGCTPAATLEVRGPGVDVRVPARAGPFEVTVALPGPGLHELSVSLREPTGHVATVTRRVTRVGP